MSNNSSKSKIRAFVAVHPDPATVSELDHLQAKLKKELDSPGIRWVSAQLHLTLVFLGSIERDRLPEYESILADVCSQHHPLALGAQGIGCFPSLRKPRVLWAGLNGQTDSLASLKSALENRFSALGHAPEEREFHPHLTLARIEHLKLREIENLSREVISHEAVRFGAWAMEKVDLMQSVLSPAGANYSLLKAFSLGNKGA